MIIRVPFRTSAMILPNIVYSRLSYWRPFNRKKRCSLHTARRFESRSIGTFKLRRKRKECFSRRSERLGSKNLQVIDAQRGVLLLAVTKATRALRRPPSIDWDDHLTGKGVLSRGSVRIGDLLLGLRSANSPRERRARSSPDHDPAAQDLT